MMETTMNVQGMTCGGCVASVTRVLQAIDGVERVDVKLDPGQARVTFDPARTNVAALARAIEDAGSDVT
jgi:copper chaperone